MKKIIMIVMLVMMAATASAKLKFKKFEATRNTCVIEMTDPDLSSGSKLNGAWLKNDGKEYDAVWHGVETKDGKTVLKAVFPFQPSLRNVTIILDVNGKRVKKNINADILDYLSSNPYLRDN